MQFYKLSFFTKQQTPYECGNFAAIHACQIRWIKNSKHCRMN